MRKYNSEYRHKVAYKIEKITNKLLLVSIYNIIVEDIGENYSTNSNGFFINLNSVSDNCIEEINKYLESIQHSLTESEQKIQYKTYSQNDIEVLTDMGHKLSNQEKIIIKRLRNN